MGPGHVVNLGGTMPKRPIVLVIAGSDSGGGAGIQADVQAIRDAGAFPTTAITAVTAQNTRGVTRVDALPPEAVAAQIAAVAQDMKVAAVKVGMLGTAELVEGVADSLDALGDVPIVVDPVMVATSGDRLLDASAEDALRRLLLPRATVLTPNLPEALRLVGAQGASAVLVTGGDVDTDDVVDVLLRPDLAPRRWIGARVGGGPFHGTGCTLSSAIAARLARGMALADAVGEGIAYVQARLRVAWRPGQGRAVLGWPDC